MKRIVALCVLGVILLAIGGFAKTAAAHARQEALREQIRADYGINRTITGDFDPAQGATLQRATDIMECLSVHALAVYQVMGADKGLAEAKNTC